MRIHWLAAAALLAAASSGSAATLADVKTGFSAVRTLEIDGKTYVGRMVAMPGKERHEQQISGFDPVFLLRADHATAEAILPKLHTVVEFPLPPEFKLLSAKVLKGMPEGRETINGVATTKYKIDETTPQGHATGNAWLSAEGIPMRLAGSFAQKGGKVTGIRWELSQVKLGPQSDALFEPPRGFSKLPPEAVAPLLGLRLKRPSP